MTLEVVLITGLSGSGKSIALKALEDAGYYCVDNLPPELLPAFVRLQHAHHGQRVAIAIDARSATSLPHLPKQLEQLQRLGGEGEGEGVQLHTLFLDANTPTLVRRFSETRRRHPLAPTDWPDGGALAQVIEHERELLSSLRECAHVIDTSNLRSAQRALERTGADVVVISKTFQVDATVVGVPLGVDVGGVLAAGVGVAVGDGDAMGDGDAVGDGVVRALRERPCMLHRFPDGLAGPKVHQKRLPGGAPDWVQTVELWFPRFGRTADELCVTELAQVIWAVQMTTVEFHPWNVRRADVDRPDEWRIDLDPGPAAGFDRVRRAASVAREVLDDLGIVPRAMVRDWDAPLSARDRALLADRPPHHGNVG